MDIELWINEQFSPYESKPYENWLPGCAKGRRHYPAYLFIAQKILERNTDKKWKLKQKNKKTKNKKQKNQKNTSWQLT